MSKEEGGKRGAKKRVVMVVSKPKVRHENEKHRQESAIKTPSAEPRVTDPIPSQALPRGGAVSGWSHVKVIDPLVRRLRVNKETGQVAAVALHPYDETERLYVEVPWTAHYPPSDGCKVPKDVRRAVLDVIEELGEEDWEEEVPYRTIGDRCREDETLRADGSSGVGSGEDDTDFSTLDSAPMDETGTTNSVRNTTPNALKAQRESIGLNREGGGDRVGGRRGGGKGQRVEDGSGVEQNPVADVVPDHTAHAYGYPHSGVKEPVSGERVQAEATPTVRTSVSIQRRVSLPVFKDSPLTDREVAKMGLLQGLVCSTCTIGPECPEYQDGYVCAYKDAFEAFPSRSMEQVLGAMRYIVDKNKTRLFRAYHYEEAVNGGLLDMNTTRQSDIVLNQMSSLLDLEREAIRTDVSMEGGSEEQQGGVRRGILSRLFTQPDSPKPSPTPSPTQALPQPSPPSPVAHQQATPLEHSVDTVGVDMGVTVKRREDR